MKSVFVAGSRKFFQDIENLVEQCRANRIGVVTAGKLSDQKDTCESEKKALFRAFERIDNSDVVYVMAKEGYIGKTVALEIAYAFAKDREIISSEMLEEYSARVLVSKIMTPSELIEYTKQN